MEATTVLSGVFGVVVAATTAVYGSDAVQLVSSYAARVEASYVNAAVTTADYMDCVVSAPFAECEKEREEALSGQRLLLETASENALAYGKPWSPEEAQ